MRSWTWGLRFLVKVHHIRNTSTNSLSKQKNMADATPQSAGDWWINMSVQVRSVFPTNEELSAIRYHPCPGAVTPLSFWEQSYFQPLCDIHLSQKLHPPPLQSHSFVQGSEMEPGNSVICRSSIPACRTDKQTGASRGRIQHMQSQGGCLFVPYNPSRAFWIKPRGQGIWLFFVAGPEFKPCVSDLSG